MGVSGIRKRSRLERKMKLVNPIFTIITFVSYLPHSFKAASTPGSAFDGFWASLAFSILHPWLLLVVLTWLKLGIALLWGYTILRVGLEIRHFPYQFVTVV